MTNSVLRGLAFEVLSPRNVFAAIEFLTLDSPMANPALNSLVSTGSPIDSQFRQLSSVVHNEILSLGIHPSGAELIRNTQSLALPPGSVDAVIEAAFGKGAGVGYAVDSSGQSKTTLWLNPTLPISLENAIPLAGVLKLDGTIVLAIADGQSVKVVQFAANGSELRSVSLDAEKYSRAQSLIDGVVLFGAENDQPVAAFVDTDFNVTEVNLNLPEDSTFASAIGLSRKGDAAFYTGTAIDSTGESWIVFWDSAGNVTERIDASDIWALQSSGESILVDTEQGAGIVVRNQALASLLEIEVDTPVVASQLAALNNRGLVNASITEVVQRGDEIYVSIIAADENGALINGVLVATVDQFHSPWQNFRNAFDVNENGQVTPMDALLVINRLRNPAGRFLSTSDLSTSFRLDVNGSGTITAADALLIINQLRRRSSAEGESDFADNLGFPHLDVAFWSFESMDQFRKSRRFSAGA